MRQAPIRVSTRFVRIKPYRSGVICNRLFVLAFQLPLQAPVVVGAAILRIKPDDFGEIGNGLVVLTFLLPREAAVVVSDCNRSQVGQ